MNGMDCKEILLYLRLYRGVFLLFFSHTVEGAECQGGKLSLRMSFLTGKILPGIQQCLSYALRQLVKCNATECLSVGYRAVFFVG